jgi:hypothetical protein
MSEVKNHLPFAIVDLPFSIWVFGLWPWKKIVPRPKTKSQRPKWKMANLQWQMVNDFRD